MSFSIQVAGRVEDALAQVIARAVENDGSTYQDPLFTTTLAFIEGRLCHWPSKENSASGVFVEATGHSDDYSQSVTLTIRPLYLKDVPAKEGA